jgi:KamA family protein
MMSLQTDEEQLGHAAPVFPSTRYKALSAKHLDEIPQLDRLSADDRFAMKVVANVLPFRSNRYVIDNLIDWDRVPDDPLYQITFPQQGMLEEVDFLHMADLMRRDASANEIKAGAHEIREKLNPHPAGQRELNIPQVAHETINGLQHKYRETVLFFPSQGQTCHAYCTFCFRWAQFVGDNTLKIVAKEADGLHDYLAAHPDVSDLLITGGDPMIMKTSVFAHYLEPLVEDPRFEHVQDIRIGTKSLTFWPSRFVGDDDADDMVRLLEKIVKAGKHVAIMAHFNHWQELETDVVREAIRRLRDAGAVIRCQAPLLAHINDSSDVWIRMWEEEVRLGMIPYYMFVERDTGARNYFEVPLEHACRIFQGAIKYVSGLSRTVRGPSMSATPGKVQVLGVTEVAGERVIMLRMLQGRNPEWVGRPFFAKYDDKASWLDALEPAFGEEKFFFDEELDEMLSVQGSPWSRNDLSLPMASPN